MSDTFRKNDPEFDALREQMRRENEPAPEYWQALLDISEDLKNAFEALKNPTWVLNGFVSLILEDLRTGKTRLEKNAPDLEDEKFKKMYAETIAKVQEFIERLEKFHADQMRVIQMRLTIHERLKKME